MSIWQQGNEEPFHKIPLANQDFLDFRRNFIDETLVMLYVFGDRPYFVFFNFMLDYNP